MMIKSGSVRVTRIVEKTNAHIQFWWEKM